MGQITAPLGFLLSAPSSGQHNCLNTEISSGLVTFFSHGKRKKIGVGAVSYPVWRARFRQNVKQEVNVLLFHEIMVDFLGLPVLGEEKNILLR